MISIALFSLYSKWILTTRFLIFSHIFLRKKSKFRLWVFYNIFNHFFSFFLFFFTMNFIYIYVEIKKFVKWSAITTMESWNLLLYLRASRLTNVMLSRSFSFYALYHYLSKNYHFLRKCGRKDEVQPRKAFFLWKHIETD